MKGQITAILTGYNRMDSLPIQIEALLAQSVQPTEILFWYNKGEKEQVRLESIDPRIKGVYANHNFKFHGRFSFAYMARTEYVAIFDDDSIPGPDWFKSCLATMKTHPGILGSAGISLMNNVYRTHGKVGWNGVKNVTPKEVDLVGHSWFFKRDWLKYFWQEMPISWDNGEDIMFSLQSYRLGGIKTYVPPHFGGNENAWGSKKISMKWGADNNATYKKRAVEHFKIRDNLVDSYIKKGYVIVKNR